MNNIIINYTSGLKDALIKLDANPELQTLFVERDKIIIGSITDGDIRRGLINGLDRSSTISEFMNINFTYLRKNVYCRERINYIKENKLKIIPVLNQDNTLHRIIDFNKIKTILPIDAVIMAGGKGSRLLPLTKNIPKPMLKIGNKPIMDYNVELLKSYGIVYLTLSVNHLADIIKEHYGAGGLWDMNISYIAEDKPLGTIGAVKNIGNIHNEYVLVMNSDLLTNINIEAMFDELLSNDADMIVATTDYQVQIPYGVIETNGSRVIELIEKPTYTYYSNAGIYILKKEIIELIPKNTYFNATDLLNLLLDKDKKVVHFSIKNYWLDIGKHDDFSKAQKDIRHINLL